MTDPKTVVLDVREDLQQGREPFAKIMRTVAQLGPNEKFLLIAPFEPRPLFAVLEQKGFACRSTATTEGDFEVLFWRNSPPENPQENSQTIEVDARGLEPPQPLVKILEAVSRLAIGAELVARTDRNPIHLYDHLSARGLIGETKPQTDGSFLTRIRRARSEPDFPKNSL